MNADGLFLTTLRDEAAADWLPAPSLRALQDRRLRTLLDRTRRFVPFYRDLHGARLDKPATADDLWQLPAVRKDDLLRAGARAYVDEREDAERLVRQTSSGSLGAALDLYASPAEAQLHAALLWTGWMAHVTIADRLFCLAVPGLRFQHQYVANTFVPVQMSAAETRTRFRDFRPTVVLGSVEAIALLAEDLTRHDVDERRQVRRIFTIGQTLTPMLRAMIGSGFEAEIFDLYGANETFWLGCECEQHEGLHVPEARVIVQIAALGEPDRRAPPGELGEVIVTSLARWTTPIIRYRLGDVAALDPTPCPCGRATPRLRRLEGRVQDFLIATDGTWVSPGAIATDLAHGQPSIRDHRIVQETRELVHVWIVPAPGFGQRDREHIAEVMCRHLGAVQVAFDLAEEIPRDPSGKRRRVYRAFDLAK